MLAAEFDKLKAEAEASKIRKAAEAAQAASAGKPPATKRPRMTQVKTETVESGPDPYQAILTAKKSSAALAAEDVENADGATAEQPTASVAPAGRTPEPHPAQSLTTRQGTGNDPCGICKKLPKDHGPFAKDDMNTHDQAIRRITELPSSTILLYIFKLDCSQWSHHLMNSNSSLGTIGNKANSGGFWESTELATKALVSRPKCQAPFSFDLLTCRTHRSKHWANACCAGNFALLCTGLG